MQYFITGIDTDSGKTLASAILCEALEADYWKPVQSGFPRDAETIKSLVSNQHTKIHPERFVLKTPASPHASAKIDGIKITLDDFNIPESRNAMIIEGAGGCLVPLNDRHFITDLIQHLKTPVILVADLYLGSINHTLLTLEALNSRKIPLKGLIFNGESNKESERIILHHANIPCLLHINREHTIDSHTVKKYAARLKNNWNE